MAGWRKLEVRCFNLLFVYSSSPNLWLIPQLNINNADITFRFKCPCVVTQLRSLSFGFFFLLQVTSYIQHALLNKDNKLYQFKNLVFPCLYWERWTISLYWCCIGRLLVLLCTRLQNDHLIVSSCLLPAYQVFASFFIPLTAFAF